MGLSSLSLAVRSLKDWITSAEVFSRDEENRDSVCDSGYKAGEGGQEIESSGICELFSKVQGPDCIQRSWPQRQCLLLRWSVSYHGCFYLGHTGATQGNSVLSEGVFSGWWEEERVGWVGFLRCTGPRGQAFVILVFPIQHFDLSATKKREFSTGKKNHTNIIARPGAPKAVQLVGQGYTLTNSECPYF